MKNKKGFTLIELLAIIVILAIIAVITTPIILNIIENSKKGAAQNSALGYKDAIQKYYASKLLEDNTFKLQGDFDINNLGELTNELEEYQIAFSGTTPSGGYATVENGKLISGCVQINEYAVRFEDGKISETKKESCTPTPVIVELYPQVDDYNPGVICGSGNVEDYDNSTTCYIFSVEDLVAFSYMVNDGKTFEDKTVILMRNLDITNDKSYINKDATNFGDINGDNTTETIKEELTNKNGKGLPTAGNDTNKFMGTFAGNAKRLNNIFINTTDNYKGLIGYNAGTIQGLILDNMDVKGSSYVGLITGYDTGTITDVEVNGSVYGYRYVGLLAGKEDKGTIKGIARGDVESTIKKDYAYTGGLVGQITSGSSILEGVYQGGTITCQNSSQCGKSYGGGDSSATISVITAASATVRGTATTSTDIASSTGYTVSDYGIKNIAIYEKNLDTFIGEDDDGNGYYYDYNENGDVELYSRNNKPLIRTMKGNGTIETPYIINNYKQFKQAAWNPEAYYKLNADINFEGKNPIMLSSTSNPFIGNFNGQNHTLSNINIEGQDDTGLFGKNNGTITGLRITNATIKGSSNVGTVGNNTGTIKGIWFDGNVTGRYYAGGLIGLNSGTATELQIYGSASGIQYAGLLAGKTTGGTIKGIAKGNVESTKSNDYAFAGGLVGLIDGGSTTVKGVYQGGTISCANGSACNKAYGSGSSGSTKSIITAASTTVKGNATTSVSISDVTGYTVSDHGIKSINVYEKDLDTFIGGDDGDGYYYDYNENGDVVLYTTTERPLTVTMSGAGTSESPYVINNYTQFKEASYNQSVYYTLNADIDFSNQNLIVLSSTANPFTGNFNGQNHTLSNINIEGQDDTGLFGKNNGTIKGIHITNATIKGASNVGLVGNNTGTMQGIWFGGNVTGRYYAGGLIGLNSGTATEFQVDGSASGIQYAGLFAGKTTGGTLKGIAKGNVESTKANDYAFGGGLVGLIDGGSTVVKGVYQSGTVTCANGSQCGKVYGSGSSNSTKAMTAAASITVNGNATTSTSSSSSTGYTYSDNDILTSQTPYTAVSLSFDNTQPYYYAIESTGVNLKSN